MAKTMFTIDGVTFPHLRVLSCEQTFEILDKDSKRAIAGNMNRNIIGTYYNYKLRIKPENSEQGMREYSKMWYMCSTPQDSHTLIVPHDCDSSGGVHTTRTFQAYITSGKRTLKKYDIDGVDYWGEGEFNFISMDKAR